MALRYVQHTVTKVGLKIRIVDYCGPVFAALGSKSATKKAIASGHLYLNGSPATTADFLKKGDVIELRGSNIRAIRTYQIDLVIVMEDNHLIIVNKPGGIAVNGNRHKTVENALAKINLNNQQPDALPRPIAVHRIDVPTSGLVILAKTKTAQIKLNKAFQEKQIEKTYLAIVHGRPKKEGRIDQPIDGKNAITEFELIRTVPSKKFGHLSLLKLKPITGRTHQLRIHLKQNGHLIVGDKMYADNQKTIFGKGLQLFACDLCFKHPIFGDDITIAIEPPPKFERILSREADYHSTG